MRIMCSRTTHRKQSKKEKQINKAITRERKQSRYTKTHQRGYHSNGKKQKRKWQNTICKVANANYRIELTLPLKRRKRESKATRQKQSGAKLPRLPTEQMNH